MLVRLTASLWIFGNTNFYLDNCLRALRATQTPGRLASAQAFCSKYNDGLIQATPSYVPSECNPSRLSSACSCIATPSTSSISGPPQNGPPQNGPPQNGPPTSSPPNNGVSPPTVTITVLETVTACSCETQGTPGLSKRSLITPSFGGPDYTLSDGDLPTATATSTTTGVVET